MKKKRTNLFILIFSAIIFSFYLFHSKASEETIIFFPIDPSHYFEDASTHLIPTQSDKDKYSVQWEVDSILNEPAYLRQDISLLYKNGQLKAILNKWKQHTQTISQKKKLKSQQVSARYDAISFHYAEVHRNEHTYTSVQQMSKARVYALTTPSFEAFQRPVSRIQKQWKNCLDRYAIAKTESALNKALVYFQLNTEKYQVICTNRFAHKGKSNLSEYSKKQA